MVPYTDLIYHGALRDTRTRHTERQHREAQWDALARGTPRDTSTWHTERHQHLAHWSTRFSVSSKGLWFNPLHKPDRHIYIKMMVGYYAFEQSIWKKFFTRLLQLKLNRFLFQSSVSIRMNDDISVLYATVWISDFTWDHHWRWVCLWFAVDSRDLGIESL